MKIEINEKVIDKLNKLGILADHIGSAIFVLRCMREESYTLLDAFDDGNNNKNALTIYKELEKIGFLKREKSEEFATNFSICRKAIDFLDELPDEQRNLEISVEDWINIYRELWINPDTGKFYVTPDKRVLGASTRDLTVNMKRFLEMYKDIFNNLPGDLTPEVVIIEATKAYIEEYKKVHFSFSKDAYYFIMKQEGNAKHDLKSLLATNCENYIESYGKEEVKKMNIFNKQVN